MAAYKAATKGASALDEVIYPDGVKELFARAIADGRLAASEESVATFMNSYVDTVFLRGNLPKGASTSPLVHRGKPLHGAL